MDTKFEERMKTIFTAILLLAGLLFGNNDKIIIFQITDSIDNKPIRSAVMNYKIIKYDSTYTTLEYLGISVKGELTSDDNGSIKMKILLPENRKYIFNMEADISHPKYSDKAFTLNNLKSIDSLQSYSFSLQSLVYLKEEAAKAEEFKSSILKAVEELKIAKEKENAYLMSISKVKMAENVIDDVDEKCFGVAFGFRYLGIKNNDLFKNYTLFDVGIKYNIIGLYTSFTTEDYRSTRTPNSQSKRSIKQDYLKDNSVIIGGELLSENFGFYAGFCKGGTLTADWKDSGTHYNSHTGQIEHIYVLEVEDKEKSGIDIGILLKTCFDTVNIGLRIGGNSVTGGFSAGAIIEIKP